MREIHNAKITGTMLGVEDHGIFTSFVYLEWEGAGIGFGGYVLGGQSGIDFIREILEVVGVEKWEDLKGKYVRVEMDGLGRPCKGIGNILKDKWLYPREFFTTVEEECDHCFVNDRHSSYCKHCGEEL